MKGRSQLYHYPRNSIPDKENGIEKRLEVGKRRVRRPRAK
jgi:hypothetical protein